jgi:hypothetical protein
MRTSTMNASQLKILASVIMVVDHIGAVFFPSLLILRVIGRIAFPIYAFLIVEGYLHTSNVHKYWMRLGVFALISEIPFDYCFSHSLVNWDAQNIFFTLCEGVLMLYLFERLHKVKPVLAYVSPLVFMIINILIHGDYSYVGILIILGFYLCREKPAKAWAWIPAVQLIQMTEILFVTGKVFIGNLIQMAQVMAIPFIMAYNGQRGRSWKYFFYAFYPGHLLLLGLLYQGMM